VRWGSRKGTAFRRSLDWECVAGGRRGGGEGRDFCSWWQLWSCTLGSVDMGKSH